MNSQNSQKTQNLQNRQNRQKILGVIPARYASTRLPGKVLADICGKPMIRRVYERALRAKCLTELVVATDDRRVADAVRAFAGEGAVVMTSPEHPNGSSRAAEVLKSRDADAVINVQGDEPLLNPTMIDEVAEALFSGPDVLCSTLCRPLQDEVDRENPNAVKVVCDRNGDALYFSRSLIPYPRSTPRIPVYEHIGIYGYRADFLRRYVELPMTPLAEAESLEQLKVLEHGYKIRVAATRCEGAGPSVDTAEDLEAVRKILSGMEGAR